MCILTLENDALAYIRQLENHLGELTEMVQQLERERDAALAAQPKWISVEEMMPEQWRANDKVGTLINFLVYMPEYGVDVGNWIKDTKMWVVMGMPVKVTHWMPLPEPPEEKGL